MNVSYNRGLLSNLIQTIRPSQWTKNAVVMAAFFFSLGDHYRAHSIVVNDFYTVLAAALLFCLVSSGVYVINDIVDAPQDRLHPLKKSRPIAAGYLRPTIGWILALFLLVAGIGGAYLLSRPFAVVVLAYVVIQMLYVLAFKQVALLDIFVISIGFVLRALAGAVILKVTISPWLLLCAFLLALFLALCKRRHEKLILHATADSHRPSLAQYNRHLLDQLIAIVSAAAVVSYAIYTLWPETIRKFNTPALAITIPFVMFGIFRYLDLVYRHEQGGYPEKILLTDPPLLIDLALYGASILAIFYFCR